MAGQADGSIIIDTEMSTDGFKAGSAEMLSAIKTLSDEVKNLRTVLTDLFNKPFAPKIDTSGTVQKGVDLQREINAVNSSVENLEPTFQKAMAGSESAMAAFESKASTLGAKITELQTQLDRVGQTKYPTQEYEALCTELEKTGQKFDTLLDRQEKMQALGVSENSTQWKSLQYDMELASDKYHELLALKRQFEASGSAFQSGADTAAYTQMEATLSAASARLEEMRASTDQVEGSMRQLAFGAGRVASFIGKAAASAAGALVSGVKNAAFHMTKMLRHSRSMKGQFSGLISSAKKFALSLLGARGVYMLLRKAVNAYMAQNQQLASTLSSCWTGIGNILGPIITKLITLVAQAVAYVTAFLRLFGIFSSSAQNAISGAGGAAEDAAKDLKRQLASFDELNILSDNKSDSGGGGSGGTNTALPDVTLPDWAKLMVEQIKSGNWAVAAITLTDQLNSMIASVDWAGVGDKIGYYFNGALTFIATAILGFDWFALGTDLATGLNRIIENVDWNNLGVILGTKFIVLINGLGGFFATLDWESLGMALSDAFMGLWNAIDWAQVAKTLSDGIKGALKVAIEFLKNTDWEKIGEDIGAFFSEIDWGGIADAAFEAFKAAIETIKGLLHGLPEEIEAVGRAFASWKISSKFMSALSTIMNIPKSLSIGVSLAITGISLEAGGIVDTVENGLDGFNFAEILGGGGLTAGGGALIGSSFGSALLGGAFGAILAGLPAFGVGIYDAIVNGLDWLNGLLIPAGSTAAGFGIGAICAAAGTAITPGIGTLIGLAVGLVADGIILIIEHWDEIVDFFSEFFTVTIPNLWDDFVTWITETVPAWFKSLPDKISGWFSDMWQPVKDFDWENLGYNIGQWFGTAVKDAIHFVTETVPDWLSGVWDSITSSLSTFFTETLPYFFTEWIPQAWEDIKTFFSDLPEKIWEAVKSGWNWLVETGEAIIDGIWEGLQTVWTAITDFVGGFVDGFKDALGIHSPSTVFKGIGDNIIAGLLEGIKATWSAITGFFSNALDGLGNLISDAWDGIKSAASSAWNGIKDTLSGAWDGIKSTASSTWDSIKSSASSAWETMKSSASSTWESIKSSLSGTWSSIKSTASSAWDSMKSSASNAWNSMKSTASSTWNGIKSSLSGTWDSIKSAASSAWGGIKDTIQNQGWSGIGSNICSGISDGINSGWTWLKNTVCNLASSLLNAAKNVLGIHSPSKLFHDEIGLNIGYGVGEGVEDSQPKILKSVSSVADAIAEEMNAGDYAIKSIIPTNQVNSAMANFADTISNNFTSLLDRLQMIAKNVTFAAPVLAHGAIPYRTAALAGGSMDVSSAIEASNDELASVVTQVVMNAAGIIVTAIQNYSGTTVNLDRAAIAEMTVREINRRTRMAGRSPLVTG